MSHDAILLSINGPLTPAARRMMRSGFFKSFMSTIVRLNSFEFYISMATAADCIA
jgi:hypothetical protein